MQPAGRTCPGLGSTKGTSHYRHGGPVGAGGGGITTRGPHLGMKLTSLKPEGAGTYLGTKGGKAQPSPHGEDGVGGELESLSV